MLATEKLAALPGAEIVLSGARDLRTGRQTINAAATAMAATRLRAAGVEIPESEPDLSATHRLYELLAADDSDRAHGRHHAICRRVASFARAAENA